MRQKILIAHAEGEDSVAEELAEPLRREGYDVIHRGTVLVGDSMTAEASKALNEGAPVVLCATVRAIGTVWARNIVRAAQPFKGVRVFPVRMERDAAVYDVVPDGTMVAEYWQSKEQALSNLVKALHAHFPAQPPESGVHERVLRDYLTIVQGKYATLPDAYRGDKFRRLTDIYIPQYLEPQDESQDLATQASPPSRPEIAGAMAVAATARVTFHQALGTGDRHLLVVGGPGTGKSSFLRHLAHEQATLWLEGKSVTQLPILISASSFCENLDRPLSALLHAACTREFGAEWQNTPLPPSIFDMPPAREGRWLVYVDGLDTIADTASLERLLAAVRNRDPKGAFRFILTSRPIPKLGVRSSGPIAVYRILPFDDERLSAFASAWYKDQPETARNFIQELARARLGTLGQIPLLATVAATLIEHHRSGVFRGRSGMYEDFVQHILREKKDQQPSAQEWLRRLETSWSNLLGPNASQLINDIFIARRALLEFVAARRREHPHETLVDACIIFIGDLLADEARLKKWLERSMPVLRDDLLPSFLIESGLVTERGGAHAFLHDTFEEYLAAASIARKQKPHDQPSLAFMARWHDPRWREILLFLLGKWSERGNDLSDLLSSVGRTTPAVSFIGTAIAEGVVVSPAFGAAIEETLLQLSRITSNAAVANGLRGLARRPSVRERLATLASDATVSPDKRISLCQLLVAIGERGPARDALRAIASTRFLPPIERGMAIASMNELSEDEASALLLEAYETLETGFEKGFLLWASGGVKVPKSDLARVQRELLQTGLGLRFFFFEVYRTRWGRDSQEEEVVRSYVNSPTATASERVRGWVELFELGRTTEAADAIATLVDDPALDAHAIASAAKTLHKTGHSAKALDVLRRHIADTSVDPSRRLTLAATLGELGHLEEAQPTLRALMDSSPKDEQPFEAADALQRLGVQDIESWFVQLAADPNVSPSARLRAARRIGDPRQLEAAAGYIREVWQHADATWPDLLTAATALGELGFVDERTTQLRALLRDHRGDAMGRMAAAEALANSGALEEARVALRTIAFDPDNDRSTRLKAARAMLRLGLRDDAAAVARRESERPWLLMASGWDFDQVLDLLSDAGHTEEAKEVLNQVLSAGPAGIDPYDYRRVIRSLGKMGYRLEAKHLVMELNSTRYLFDHVDTLMVAEMLDELGFADDAKSVLWSLIEGSSLRDYDRVRAAEMLGKLDSEEAARAILREMIVDPSLYRSARSQAYKQLVALGDDADAVGVQLTATATNTEPKRRVDVAITLNEIGQIDKSRDLAQGVLNDAGADFASRVDAAALLGIARVAGTAKLELENMLPSSGDDLSWEQVDKLIALGITERLKQPLAERIISMDGTSEQFHAKKAIETLDKLGFGTVADDGLIEVSKSQTATDVCRNWSIAKLLERGRKEEAVAVLESAVSVEEMQPERRIATIEKLAELSDSEYLRVAISEMARRPDLATPVKRRIAEVAHKAGFATLAFDVLSDVAETATDDYGRVEAARRLAAMGFETKANEILRAAAERPGIGLSDRLYVVNAMVDAGLVDTASKAVLELSEDANGLRLDVGHLLQRLGRQTEAIGHFTKVATGDQVRPEVRLRAARELLANGADGEALEVVRQIIGTDDAPLETRIGAVETLSHAGYNAEAGEALRGILKENHAGGLVLVPAYLALGELGFKEDATAGIAAILSTTGLMPPPTAVFALADWGSPLAVEAVKTICSNVDEDRFVDVRGNRLVPLQAALEFLEELLEQGHRDVAYAGIDQLLQNRSVVAQRRLVRWTAERLLRANGDRTSRSTEDIPARMQHRFADTWERRHRD